MKTIEISKMNEKQLDKFILDRLSFGSSIDGSLRHIDRDDSKKQEHYRFEMSGFDMNGVGSCTKENLFILNLFANCGIYDYTKFMFLDFYKGVVTLYFQYWRTDDVIELDLSGYGTRQIIKEVIERTVLSGKSTRRR
jgi:hypothetical protein